VKVSSHTDARPVPEVLAASVQLAPLPNDPLVDVEKSTVPVGGLPPLAAVSVTVAVQVVGTPTPPDAGEQYTLVLVGSTSEFA
jgi:hypothetical protein